MNETLIVTKLIIDDLNKKVRKRYRKLIRAEAMKKKKKVAKHERKLLHLLTKLSNAKNSS